MTKRLSAFSLLILIFAATLPAQNAQSGAITGVGNFSHIVTSLEKAVEFYRDVIGLTVVTPPQQFSGNPAIMKMGNTPGAQSRIAVLRAPGTAIGVELIEYKDIDRKPANPRFQDPGAANLQVRVRDKNIACTLTKMPFVPQTYFRAPAAKKA